MNEDNVPAGCAALLIMIAAIFSLGIGIWIELRLSKDEAVKAGHAEYYIDKNNNKQFRWKQNIEEEAQ